MLKVLSHWMGVAAFALLALAPAARAEEPAAPPLPELFDDLEKRTFDYFWKTTDAKTGLVPDRWPYDEAFSSIAAIGFALTAYPLGAERGYVTREAARERVLATLRYLDRAPQGPLPHGMSGYRGFYYHFLALDTGHRYAPWVELSSVDTTLMLGGVLFAQSYYGGDHADEREIREIAERLYRRVDWPWMQKRGALLSMGWFPESGFIEHDWRGYNEAMLVYLLALGSPTHPIEPEAWDAWTATYDRSWGTFQGETHLGFAPMFGHQYSHVWVDFRGIADAYMKKRGLDYFENSRRATLAQRKYAIENPGAFVGYGENEWGLTASDGPGDAGIPSPIAKRWYRGYSARGAAIIESFDDGTIAPTAALGSLPFAPEIVIPAAVAMHANHGEHIYGEYGFLDAFNRTYVHDVGQMKYGKLVRGFGWVDDQYIGIDQGPIFLMAQNYRRGRVWEVMKTNAHLRRGLERAGFTGGWLEAK